MTVMELINVISRNFSVPGDEEESFDFREEFFFEFP